ncbi:MAG: SDR family NAD(P)-dependent oxidoreductase [Candidatus Gracilibacteria bacterium]|nr:SDR family NAD(P)-dependent oxidoreductase [Candidatus Gracilibacteria bacterium]
MKTILITGTTSGIGNYLASNLKNDNKIIGVGRSENNIENIDFISGDLKDLSFLAKIEKSISEIDYLVLNAGIGYFDNFKNISIEQNKEILETNLISPILLTNLLLNSAKIKSGIIFIGSIAGKKSAKNGASYAASKFGLRGFAMQLKNEIKGIKIHIINPKIVNTNFHKNSKIEIVGKYEETKIDDIYSSIFEIINGNETRFEIDL